MPSFSPSSLQKLKTLDSALQRILNAVIRYYDFTVISGHRGEEEQNRLFKEKKSKLKFPQSKHNRYPSDAVDIAPYPIDWKDKERFFLLAGAVLYEARYQDVLLRWGGDWNMDGTGKGERFRDLGHFELVRDASGNLIRWSDYEAKRHFPA